MIEENASKLNKILIGIIAILVIFIGMLLMLYLNKKCNCSLCESVETTTSSSTVKETKSTQVTSTPPDVLREHQVHSLLIKYGEEYYKYIYPSISNKNLEEFSKYGIETDLESIINHYTIDLNKDISSEFMLNGKQFVDIKKTKIIFYPKEPYGINDVDVRVSAVYNH